MVGVTKKIITEGTGVKLESKTAPLIEFMGPDVIKVPTCSRQTGVR